MTTEDFYKILQKPNSECEGFELYLKNCWDNNNAKSIFTITGLDFGHILVGEVKSSIFIKNPNEPFKVIYR